MSRRFWTTAEIKILKEKYSDTPIQKLMEIFQCSDRRIYNKANQQGLKRSPEFIAETTRKNQLQLIAEGKHKGYIKGSIPMNKGKKMTPELKEKLRQTGTWFSKGNIPHNHRRLGSTRITKDGYIEIKIKEPRTWQLLHRHNWEKKYGKIEKGFNIIFENGNKQDCRIENLQMISDTELMSRNTIQRYPKDLQKTLKTLSKFKKIIKEHESN